VICSISELWKRLQIYQEDSLCGSIYNRSISDNGIRILFPDIERHFYIFHKIGGGNTPEEMVCKYRFLFYQVPYSEWNTNKRFRAACLSLLRQESHPNTLWKYPHAEIDDEYNMVNDALAGDSYSIVFDYARAVHKLIGIGSSEIEQYSNFLDEYQSKNIVREFFPKCPEGYHRELWELERHVLYEGADRGFLVRQYPLFHDGIWVGILVLLIAEDRVKSKIEFDQQVQLCLPIISEKMHRFVVRSRFETSLSGGFAVWAIDQLSRIAASMTLNAATEMKQNVIRFYRWNPSDHPPLTFPQPEKANKCRMYRDIPIFNRMIRFEFGEQGSKERMVKYDETNSMAALALNDVQDQAKKVAQRLWFQRKAAAAAILSRNMSHHIGSHVIPRSRVKNLRQRLIELYNVRGEDDYFALDSTERLKTSLDDYVQQKADFLAEVATDPNNSSNSKHLMRDVISPFVSNALLMDSLASTEGFHYLTKDECTLKLSLYIKQDGKCQRILGPDPPAYDPLFGEAESSTDAAPDRTSDHILPDPMVSFPGILGHYALYGILENIIRNSAKHNDGSRNDGFLHIHLLIEDDPDPKAAKNCFRLRIWDNLSNADKTIAGNIPGSGEKTRTLSQYLNDWLKADLIDEHGEVRREAWGIAEILICANLLAGRSDYSYDDKTLSVVTDAPLDASRDTLNGNRVIYNFRLLKTKTAVFVGQSFINQWSNDAEQLQFEVAGIDIFRDAKLLLDYLGQSIGRQAVQFAVFEDAIISALDAEQAQIIRAGLPFRVIRVNGNISGRDGATGDLVLKENPFIPMNGSMTPYDLQGILWDTWLGELRPSDHYPVAVVKYMDIEKKDDQYNKWSKAAINFNKNANSRSVKLCIQARKQEYGSEDDIAMEAAVINARIRINFDHHGKSRIERLGPRDSYEVFHKRNLDWDCISSSSLPESNISFWPLPYTMAEAGLLRILVIDERIAERAMQVYDKDNEVSRRLCGWRDNLKPRFWHMAFWSKVFIATHLGIFANPRPLHAGSYQKAEAQDHESIPCPRLELLLDDNGLCLRRMDPYNLETPGASAAAEWQFDIVVIHQGVLDTHCPENKNQKQLREFIIKTNPWLVIESGRGIPPGLQKQPIRFLPFSLLDQALVNDGIGKLSFSRRLMALPRFLEGGDSAKK
jgi:hypothetical protein